MDPLISLVVPTYGRCASVERLLRALNQQNLPAEYFEVIVVIDGSTDGTLELVEHTQTDYLLRGIWQTNQGRASARNQGVRAAQGSLVVFLDDDMEPAPPFLEAHWNTHQAQSRLGVLGAVPIHLDAASPPVMQYIGTKFNKHLEKLAQPDHTLILSDFYSGNFSIRRSTLTEVGLFDGNFKEYGNEDLELFWRLRQADIQVVFSKDALAVQHNEKDFATLAMDNIAKGKTSVQLVKIHPESISETRLIHYDHESLQWRLFRAGLIQLSQSWKQMPQLVIRVITWLEKRRSAMLPKYYYLSLDYFYWLGVRNAEQ